jgi:hypothetical protein
MDTLFFRIFDVVPCCICRFLAENWREHIVERKREKEYIRSMIEDLKLDTAGLASDNNTEKRRW